MPQALLGSARLTPQLQPTRSLALPVAPTPTPTPTPTRTSTPTPTPDMLFLPPRP